MDTPFDIKKQFPLEDQPIAGHLGKFIISFVQALLKIGHFQTGDAKGATAKQALFQEWSHLAQRDREVSFIIQNHENTSVVLVYGILSEITPLEKLFSPDMAELFTPKVFDFFNRRYLGGFTLKPAMTLDEFDRFIEIMQGTVNPADIDHEIQTITERLIHQQITHASIVYAKELFVGSGTATAKEPLHFMTQMVLTRFEKELRMIPLHPHLTKDQKMEQKERVFKDILVPLSDTAILKEILMHCSEIDLSGWDTPIDVEMGIGKGLGKDLVWKFLLESAHALKENVLAADHDRLISIVKKIVLNLSLDKMKDESEEILEVLLQEKTITLLEIPDLVLDRVYLKRKTDDYLQNKARYWEGIQKRENNEKFNALILILPVLLKRNEFVSFGELLDQMRLQWKGEASNFLAQVGMASMQETILSKISDRHIPTRKELFVILEPLSLFLCTSLLPLCADEDIFVRRNICKVLATTGKEGIPPLIAYANDPTRNWYTLRNVAMILGDIGLSEESVLVFLKRCQRHPNLRVREEVMASYGKMKGSQVEKLLLKELENPDITFRSRAVSALGNFHPMNAQVRTFIEEAIKQKRKNESETDDQVQVSCCLALETIARIDPASAQHFEPILCNALTPDKPGMFGLVREKHHEKGYEVKRAICRVLGEIGTKSAFPLVGRLITEKYWRPEDRVSMQQILQKIERRVGVGE
jgi:hypothetical protein